MTKTTEEHTGEKRESFFEIRQISRTGLKKTLRIFRYTLPYKGLFFAGFVFLILATGTSLLFPKLVGEVVRVIEGKSAYTINQITGLLLVILVAQALFSFLRIYTFTRVSERAMADVRLDLYRRIVDLPLKFFESHRVGELTSRITNDVSKLDNVLSFTIAELFRQIVTLFAGTVLILFISWKLTLFMLATFPAMVIAALFFGRYIRRLSRKAQDELARANVVAEETMQSIQVVKAFTNEALEVSRYRKSLSEVVKLMLRAATFRGGFVSFLISVMFGGIVGVVWYGANLVLSGEMIIADLFTFVLYTSYIGASLGSLGDMYAQINSTIGASERILEIMDEAPEEQSGAGAPVPAVAAGHIEYRKVKFSYPSRPDIEVLHEVSLSVKAGERVAFVGYSGAGKSTLVQLLMRFYDLTEGEIRIDGRLHTEIPLRALRESMAVVPQEVILFGGTIRENIAYGKPGADEEEIREAARKAHALEFISSFPEGLDTIVGERGVKLSGGQRQRIAIARAILKDPKILILDEATSSLDSSSERLVQEALNELMVGRTTIIIAHRLATIRNVDTIYVIREGRIAEQGSHEKLSAIPDGLYASLIRLQSDTVAAL